jgi:Ca2+-binding EF-hand superfamily protein
VAWLLPCLVHAQATPSAYLAQFDRNGDGHVSEAEYVAYMSRGFAQMDANGDGVLERSELPGGRGKPTTLAAFQANLRRQFHKLDRNHDGQLTLRELLQPPQP